MLNFDETELGGHADCRRVAARGCRICPAVTNKSSEPNFTCCATISASGLMLPDLLIMKGKRTPSNLLENARKGTKILKRPDGYFMTAEVFVETLGALAATMGDLGIPVSPSERCVLLIDGCKAHLHPECVLEGCRLGWDVVVLPAGLTHLLQPCNQLFGPLKQAYYKLCNTARLVNGGRLSVEGKLGLWNSACKEKVSPEMVKRQWEKTGLWPPKLDVALQANRNFAG